VGPPQMPEAAHGGPRSIFQLASCRCSTIASATMSRSVSAAVGASGQP
jgi:hypothetical protein